LEKRKVEGPGELRIRERLQYHGCYEEVGVEEEGWKFSERGMKRSGKNGEGEGDGWKD